MRYVSRNTLLFLQLTVLFCWVWILESFLSFFLSFFLLPVLYNFFFLNN